MSDHHPHGPSTLPKLAKCTFFLGGKAAGEAAGRGTMLHQQIADTLNFNGSPSKAPQVEPEAQRGVERLNKLINALRGVEQQFSLLNENLEELNFGTVDAWGYSLKEDQNGEKILTIVDFKSGAMIAGPQAYTEQLACYGLMLMDHEQVDYCEVAIIPLDDPDTDYHIASFTREEAEAIVLPIFERLKDGSQQPQENDGCNWCARRETCAVWLKPAETALTVVDALPATISREWIEASPQNAGMALQAFKKLEAIFKDIAVSDKVKSAIEAGDEVPGWKLQSRKGSESVSAEEVLTKILKGMGIAKLAPFLKVDAKGLQKAWADFTTEPFPCAITEGTGTISLVQERRAK
jgi:hypothetical protein